MASCQKREIDRSERIERDVRAVTAEKPGQRADTKPAKKLNELLPQTLQTRGRRRAEGCAPIGFGAEASLRPIKRALSGRAYRGDRRDSVCLAAVAGVSGRVEHVGQTGPQVAGNQPSEDLEQKRLGALMLGFGEGVAPSGEGSDCLMGSTI